MENNNWKVQEIEKGVIISLLVAAVFASYSVNNQLVILAEKVSVLNESIKELKGDKAESDKRIRDLEIGVLRKQK